MAAAVGTVFYLGLNVHSPPNSHVESLMSNVKSFGDGAFDSYLDSEDGVLMIQLVSLEKLTQDS